MKNSWKRSLLTIVFSAFITQLIFCRSNQNDSAASNKVLFDFHADLVSRYIWRGLPLDLSPNIQPYATISFGNLSLCSWSSYSVSSSYAEIDWYLYYEAGPVAISLSDYFNEDERDLSLNDYLRWGNSDSFYTGHSVEASIILNGPENLPLSLTAATFIYGNDRDTITNKNQYSTYLELAYTQSWKDFNIKYFVGGTIRKGFYADKAAIINIGLSASKEIEITNKFSLPVFTSLILNPNANDIFVTFGMTF
jgi:hypothetical protein